MSSAPAFPNRGSRFIYSGLKFIVIPTGANKTVRKSHIGSHEGSSLPRQAHLFHLKTLIAPTLSFLTHLLSQIIFFFILFLSL
ncbi:hypothetical protein L1887_01244 [Cichorium endivia]|nr:hypothetical protein L1887_01244 [Cichorium endivia]